jgi:hypothetical protein
VSEVDRSQPLASERIIINSAMSFAGSAQRAWRMRETAAAGVGRFLITLPIVLLVIPVWWVTVLVWYVVGLWMMWPIMLPYRILRRGARKRKAEALRHRELLDAVERRR